MEYAELHNLFSKAIDYVKASTDKLDSLQLLYLYSRFKQINTGPCDTSRPGFLDFKGKQKWDAWKQLGNMSKEKAMFEYISKLDDFDSEWLEKMDSGVIVVKAGLGLGISTLCRERPLPDDSKTIFDWCKDDNVQQVVARLSAENIDEPDDKGMSLLHWACDHGSDKMAEALLQRGATVNQLDSEGQTGLHYAVSCGHLSIVKLLMENGVDPFIRNNDGEISSDLYESDFDPKIINLLKT